MYLLHHSFCKFKRERSENVFGEVWFLLALDGPSRTVAMSLYANVLLVQSSVPTMFLIFFANGRVPPFRIFPLSFMFPS